MVGRLPAGQGPTERALDEGKLQAPPPGLPVSQLCFLPMIYTFVPNKNQVLGLQAAWWAENL